MFMTCLLLDRPHRKLLLIKGDEEILKGNTQMGDQKYRIGSDPPKFYSKVPLKSGFKKIAERWLSQ